MRARRASIHLSRLAEDVVIWASAEFGFIRLADEVSTGSSLMPQKKNPDIAELLRGRAGRSLGSLVSLASVLKGLPLAYDRDLQEDKPALFAAVDNALDSLDAAALLVQHLEFDRARLAAAASDPGLLATDAAEVLVHGRHAVPQGPRDGRPPGARRKPEGALDGPGFARQAGPAWRAAPPPGRRAGGGREARSGGPAPLGKGTSAQTSELEFDSLMLLAVDVGNTNVTLALFDGDRLVADWRVTSHRERTADEMAVELRQLFELRGFEVGVVDGVVISSVVPTINSALVEASRRYLKCEPLMVGPGVKTSVRIRYDNPKDVGADRIANALAAYSKYGGPVVVIDFGTAVTYDAINAEGDYLGGAIAPGVEISLDALVSHTAMLRRVEAVAPDSVIGRNTVASIQSGLVWGFVAQVEGMVQRMVSELGRLGQSHRDGWPGGARGRPDQRDRDHRPASDPGRFTSYLRPKLGRRCKTLDARH